MSNPCRGFNKSNSPITFSCSCKTLRTDSPTSPTCASPSPPSSRKRERNGDEVRFHQCILSICFLYRYFLNSLGHYNIDSQFNRLYLFLLTLVRQLPVSHPLFMHKVHPLASFCCPN
ncbi:UNVERIFIED_CONTAM: hypothetical protein Slati_1485400 [Sesamum latifolium]|uniref:Uncharacterized protein n=1 Tax=Sesamum latifolium TaxID=2727402 RepID=A0AAW2X5C2_9LAMI